MKRRLLAMILVLSMCITMLPVGVMAEDGTGELPEAEPTPAPSVEPTPTEPVAVEPTPTPAVCLCEQKCTEENINTLCPACGAGGEAISACVGEEAVLAAAEEVVRYPLWVDGESVSSANAASLAEGKASYDAATNTLYLKGGIFNNSIKNSDGYPCILYYSGTETLTISVSGLNTISTLTNNGNWTGADGAYAIWSGGPLSFVGGGYLEARGGTGIYAAGSVTIGSDVHIAALSKVSAKAINSGASITFPYSEYDSEDQEYCFNAWRSSESELSFTRWAKSVTVGQYFEMCGSAHSLKRSDNGDGSTHKVACSCGLIYESTQAHTISGTSCSCGLRLAEVTMDGSTRSYISLADALNEAAAGGDAVVKLYSMTLTEDATLGAGDYLDLGLIYLNKETLTIADGVTLTLAAGSKLQLRQGSVVLEGSGRIVDEGCEIWGYWSNMDRQHTHSQTTVYSDIGETQHSKAVVCKNCLIHHVYTPATAENHSYNATTGLCACGAEKPAGQFCGDNLTWTLEDGVLTISGTGAMWDYSFVGTYSPWHDSASQIEKVIIGSGVTYLGKCAFYKLTNLKWVFMPASVTSLNTSRSPFSSCSDDAILFYEAAAAPADWGNERTWADGMSVVYGCSAQAADYWMSLNPDATSISIPDYITTIYKGAFANFGALKEIEIPSSVTKICEEAFENCTSLRSVFIPASVLTIEASDSYYSPFNGCSADLVIYCEADAIPDGWATYWRHRNSSQRLYCYLSCTRDTFDYWRTLDKTQASIAIPDGITRIPVRAFAGCTSLTELIIPDSVKGIDSLAFSGCTGLRQLYIPASVTTISAADDYSGPFYNCSANLKIYLEAESVPDGWDFDWNTYAYNKHLSWGAGYNRDDYQYWGEFSADQAEVTIPEGITLIPTDVFQGNTTIRKVTIPAGVTRVASYAFENCAALEEVVFLGDKVNFGSYVFSGCESLERIVFPKKQSAIPEGMFSGCSSLSSLPMPETLVSVGKNAFAGCTGLTSLYFPASVVSMGSKPFLDCVATLRVYSGAPAEPDGWSGDWNRYKSSGSLMLTGYFDVNAEEYAFFSSISPTATAIVIPDTVKKIPAWHFQDFDNLRKVEVSGSVECIAEYAFWSCGALTEVILHDGLQTIGESAFAFCSNLQTINIPSTVAVLEKDTFWCCGKLSNVTLDEGLKVIEAEAFEECPSLFKLAIPYSIEYVGYLGSETDAVLYYKGTMFEWCNVSSQEAVCSDGTVLIVGSMLSGHTWFIDDKYTLTLFGEGPMDGYPNSSSVPWSDYWGVIKNVVVMDGVTKLGECAFWGCYMMESISLPETLQWIDKYAFSWCWSLKSITIPRSVNTISYQAFYDCFNLKEIVFRHGEQDELLIAAEAFILETDDAKTTVKVPVKESCNPAIRNYDWVGSLRKVTYKSHYCNGVHYPVEVPGLEATCTEGGYSASSYCGACGSELAAQTVVPALGHEKSFVSQLEPTCTEEGHTTYFCSRCSSEYDADFVPALGHCWDGGVITGIPAPGVSGEIVYTCGVCTELKIVEHSIVVSDEIPAQVVAGKAITLQAKDLASGETLKSEAVKWTLPEEYAAFASVTAAGKLTAKAVEIFTEIKVIGTLVSNPDIRVECALAVVPATAAVSITDGSDADVTGATLYFNRHTTENVTFAAVTTPVDALDGIEWSSSDSKGTYATVTDNGDGTVVVSDVKKNGTVTLTAKATDGSGKSAKVTLKIGYYATDIAITNAPEAMRGGAVLTLKHSLTADSTLTSKNVIWSVSDDSIPYAKIDAKGKLTTYAVSEPVTITVTAQSKENPAVSHTVDIFVHPAVRSVAVTLNGEPVAQNATVQMELFTGSVDFDTYSEPGDAIQRGTWTSSSKKVATIDENGVVTAVAPGTSTMTFKADDGSNKSIKVKVKVYKISTDLALTAPTEVVGGKSVTVKAALTAADGSVPTDKTLLWSSSNESVATVKNGKVSTKAVYENTNVTITATPRDGGAAAQSVTICVQPAKPDTLVIHYEGMNATGKTLSVDFDESDRGSLGASLYSKTGGVFSAAADVVWSSSNKKVADFDAEGALIFTGGSGKTTLTAKCGALSAKLTLNVVKRSANLSLTAATEVVGGKAVTVTAALTASDGGVTTDKTLLWSSSNESVATVKNGKVSTKAVYENTYVTITAVPRDGGAAEQSVSILLKPAKAESLGILADGVNVTAKTLTLDYDSPAPSLRAEVYSAELGQYLAASGVTWSSSNKKVATIDANGTLSYVGVGSTTITAKQGKTSVKFTLKLTRQVAEIVVASKTGTTNVISGKSLTLTATVMPTNANSKKVIWASSDESVATVKNGKVTAKTVYSRKTVTITATAQDGSGAVGQVTLTVLPLATTVSILSSDNKVLNNRTVTVSLAEVQSMQLSAKVYPAGVYGALQDVTWASSSKKVAGVDQSGLVTILKPGKTTIKITAADGSKKTTSFTLVVTE